MASSSTLVRTFQLAAFFLRFSSIRLSRSRSQRKFGGELAPVEERPHGGKAGTQDTEVEFNNSPDGNADVGVWVPAHVSFNERLKD